MHFNLLTLFPGLLQPYLEGSLLGRAILENRLSVNLVNFREFATDKHQVVDDTPFGGGEGMVLKAEPLAAALRSLSPRYPVVLMSPGGVPFTQEIAEDISGADGLTLVCGRYEGVDQRLIDTLVDQELSIGPYVLAGGELAALVVIETVARLLPGVVGNPDSVTKDSFTSGGLKHGQYTRPREWEGLAVPEVLLGGNHKDIDAWRAEESARRSAKPQVWRPIGGKMFP